MAHLDYRHNAMMDAMVTLAVENIEDLNPRDVTELVSALALSNHNVSSREMDSLAQHMTVLLSEPGMLLC